MEKEKQKKRYEPPKLMDLGREDILRGQDCPTGSVAGGFCSFGVSAGEQCSTGSHFNL